MVGAQRWFSKRASLPISSDRFNLLENSKHEIRNPKQFQNLKYIVVGELGDLPAIGSRGRLGRVADRDQGNQFLSFRDLQYGLGLVVVEQTDHHRTQAEGVGGQANVLAGDPEVKHEPVAELGGDLVPVEAGTLQFAAEGQQDWCLNDGAGGRVCPWAGGCPAVALSGTCP
jgi:hypothetical protein